VCGKESVGLGLGLQSGLGVGVALVHCRVIQCRSLSGNRNRMADGRIHVGWTGGVGGRGGSAVIRELILSVFVVCLLLRAGRSRDV
jgi:hypothetical protein